MKKFLLALMLIINGLVYSTNIPVIVFSFSTGWMGIKNSNGIGSSGYTASYYGIKNIYFKNTNDLNGTNIMATCVFEMQDGSEIEIDGQIFARATTGNNINGLHWTPYAGSTSVGGYLIDITKAVTVQMIGSTVSVSGSNGSISIGGNSGNLTMQDLIDYASSYPNVITNTSVSSITGTSVNWGGYLGASANTFSFTKAGIAYSPQTYTNGTPNPISVDPALVSQTKTEMVSSTTSTTANTVYNFSGPTTGLQPNTKYYYRAYVVYGGQTYQGPQESFTTCADMPTGTPATICSGNTATISATGVGTLTWYDQSSGGTLLATGSSYTTPTLTNSGSTNTTSTYYVQDANSSCPSNRTSVTVTIKPVTSVVNTCNSIHTCPKSGTATVSTNTVQSGSGAYTWYSNTTNSNQNGTAVGNTNSSQSIPSSTSGVYYYYYTLNDGCGTITSPVQEVIVYDNKWLGTTSDDWSVGSNWSAGTAPGASDVLVIPSASVSNFPTVTNITINNGGAIVLLDDANLTMTGSMTNNGKLILNSGATFVYTSPTPFASGTTGEFIFKQDAAGKSGLYGGLYQPIGRYWYMGVPFSQPRSVFGTAISAVEANGPYSSKVWGWDEAGGAVWSEITSPSQTLNPTEGYLVRLGGSCKNLEFNTTAAPYVAEINKSVSKTTGGNNSLDGFNLVSNPFPAYIDAVAMKTASTNIGNTIWYRTYNSNNNQMVFDHFQANSPNASIINSNAGHTSGQLQKIPPYQAFWVRVQGNSNAVGNVKINRTMTTHESNGMHLKTFQDYKAFVRMNLSQGTKSDQMVVYMDQAFEAGFDSYDGEKMFVANMPQVYTKTGSHKLAIQSLAADKSKTSVPVSVEIPSPTVYEINFVEHQIQNGKVYLEDKKLGVFVDLDVDTAYTFFSTSGTIHDRFVLHFRTTIAGGLNPSIVDDWSAPLLGKDEAIVVKNIANQGLEIECEDAQNNVGRLIIFDQTGRLIETRMLANSFSQYQPLNHGAGIYLVQIQIGEHTTAQKILIQ